MAYSTATELARILKIRTPTTEQTAAMTRVLDVATVEIDAEIDRATDATALTSTQIELLEQVCLDRAADLWHHTESRTGLTGLLGGEEGAVLSPGRYSWERYAQRLAPLKSRWGLA